MMITQWNFLSPDEREAFRNSPIIANIEAYIKRHNLDYSGSSYAFRFQSVGLPEALIRYTRDTTTPNA